MGKQVQASLDQAVYDRLLELKVPPFSDINAVGAQLLYRCGRKSRAAAQGKTTMVTVLKRNCKETGMGFTPAQTSLAKTRPVTDQGTTDAAS